MANEIKLKHTSGQTAYAVVRNSSLQVFDVGDGAFENQGTWNDARVGECDITLTETATVAYGWYVASMPTAVTAAGLYYIEFYQQAGTVASTSDTLIQGETWQWSGAARLYGNVDGVDSHSDAASALEKAAKLLGHKTAQAKATGTITIYDSTGTAAEYTKAQTNAASTLTFGAIS